MTQRARPEHEEVHAPHATLPQYYQDEQARRTFVRRLFDETASEYDRVERMMALGTGPWYRRRALVRSGLEPGMEVLDVAVGTGLLSREAVAIAGSARRVTGVDPSRGMLQTASRKLDIVVVQGMAESLPFASNRFDFLSLGFALRHMSDISVTFSEFFRVLKPGGAVCVLELTRPDRPIARRALKAYIRGFVPFLARLAGSRGSAVRLYEYFWDTIDACVSPERVLAALRRAGFSDVERFVEIGIFSEYTGRKPGDQSNTTVLLP